MSYLVRTFGERVEVQLSIFLQATASKWTSIMEVKVNICQLLYLSSLSLYCFYAGSTSPCALSLSLSFSPSHTLFLYFSGIPELLKLDQETSCEWLMMGSCLRGTIQMDEWVNRTLSFQRQLALDTPINAVQFLGSHNSFNNKADG